MNNNNKYNYGRRQGGDVHHHHHNDQEVQWNRSHHHKKPPLHDEWRPTIPSWEKAFCRSVGLVPWEKLLRTKKLMYLYENVVQWNDSACEEAFHNAKSRFWAEINGLPCNLPLPHPDTYIDKIDWNSEIDPEFLLDLEHEPKELDKGENSEEVVILGITNQSSPCTGWDEAEDNNKWLKVPESTLDLGCVVWGQNANIVLDNDSPRDNCRGNSWNDSFRWQDNHNNWENNNSGWNNVNNGNWGTWGWNSSGKKEGGSGGMYKTSRIYGEDRVVDRGWWRNGRGRKRVKFVF